MDNRSYFYPNKYDQEGVDHINIFNRSNCLLGRLLDTGYVTTIEYKPIGIFSSVRCLWTWLLSEKRSSKLRFRKQVKSRSNTNEPHLYIQKKFIPNFKAIIGYATWLKIQQFPDLINEIKTTSNPLPFLCYRIEPSNGLRLCCNHAGVIIEIANIIIDAIREDKDPNFTSICTHPNAIKDHYLELFLKDNPLN